MTAADLKPARAAGRRKPADPAPKRRSREIIDAAAAVFAERSFHGTSTQEIAERLGIRQASLYYYFTSKEEALGEVCRLGVEGFLESAQSIAARALPAAARVAAIIESHLAPNDVKSDYVKVFMSERQHLGGEAGRNIARIARAYEGVIESVIRGGVTSGEFAADTDPRLAALALLGMCNEAARWINTARAAGVDDTARVFTALLLRGLVRRD